MRNQNKPQSMIQSLLLKKMIKTPAMTKTLPLSNNESNFEHTINLVSKVYKN